MFTPGMLTREQAILLNQLLQQVQEQLNRKGTENPIPYTDHAGGYHTNDGEYQRAAQKPIMAVITSRADSDGFHSWTERFPNNSIVPAFEDKNPAATGTQAINPAFERNGFPCPVGTEVLLYLHRYSEEYDWVYVFDYPCCNSLDNAITITPSENVDDYDPEDYDRILIDPTTPIDFTGLIPVPGKPIIIENISEDYIVTIPYKDPDSETPNQFDTITGTDIKIPPGTYIEVIYDEENEWWDTFIITDGPVHEPTPITIIEYTDDLETKPNETFVITVTGDNQILTGIDFIGGNKPGDKYLLTVSPLSPYNLTITDYGSSTTGNQFLTTTGTSLTLEPGKSVEALYTIIDETYGGDPIYGWLITGGTGYADYLISTYPVIHSLVLTEPIGLYDEYTINDFGQIFPLALADSIGLQDSFSRVVDYMRSLNEAIGLYDTISRVANYARSLSDTVGLSDDPTLSLPGVSTACCGNSLPETLTLTFTQSTDCCYTQSASISLTWNPSQSRWEGTDTSCGFDSIFYFYCDGVTDCTDFVLEWICDGLPETPVSADGGCSCSPLSVSFSLFPDAGATCCGVSSTLQITITE